ncbi:MAG: chorismate synthase [Oscillospiraceae bacterium]|jgi:chorismate synthase|nr:chorismate synthase [Oscillospiraceae bacterium]
MSSTWGKNIKISIFGESHGVAIGVVIDGLPAGEKLDLEELQFQMSRRAPGNDATATPRKEQDLPEICAGILSGTTTGAPLCAVIENTNTRPVDYDKLSRLPRPGHADYTGAVRYNGYNDVRGGGHFSGRLTAPLTFAGAVCKQILARRGVTVGGHILSIGNVFDHPFDPMKITAQKLGQLSRQYFSLQNDLCEEAMRKAVRDAEEAQDSVGGMVEIAVVGVPAGIGTPMFYGVENVLSSIVYGVPAVKGVEFGAGFNVARMRGSECNDPFTVRDDKVVTTKNTSGGILGGITTGMPIIMRAAIKPTPSISQKQQTVDLREHRDAMLTVGGRHDPCIVPRALPAIEAATAVGIADLMADAGKL